MWLPPGMRGDTREILQNAFRKVAEKLQAREETRKLKMDIPYTSAPEVLKLIQCVLGQPADIAAEVAKHGKF